MNTNNYKKACDLLDKLRGQIESINSDFSNVKETLTAVNRMINQLELDYNKQVVFNIENTYRDKFEKVIFTDIDGVLNDGEHRNNKHTVDNDKMVRLKQIIDATGASVVITSPWKVVFQRYFDYIREHGNFRQVDEVIIDKTGLQILEAFKKYKIKISGMTDTLVCGKYARSAEIRKWLIDKPYIKSFVILDGEDLWQWNWLKEFLVLTKVSDPTQMNYSGLKGLSDDDVVKAIKILNEYAAVHEFNAEDRDDLVNKLSYYKRQKKSIKEIASSLADTYNVDKKFLEGKLSEIYDSGEIAATTAKIVKDETPTSEDEIDMKQTVEQLSDSEILKASTELINKNREVYEYLAKH